VSPHPSIPVSQYPYIPHPCAFAVELRQTKGTGRKWGLGNGELCLDYAYAVLSSGSFRLWDLSWGGEMGSRKESATHMHGNRSSWRMEKGECRVENGEWRGPGVAGQKRKRANAKCKWAFHKMNIKLQVGQRKRQRAGVAKK